MGYRYINKTNTSALTSSNVDKTDEATITVRQRKYFNNMTEWAHRNI